MSAYPDFSKPFRLYTDASNIGSGGYFGSETARQGKDNLLCLSYLE